MTDSPQKMLFDAAASGDVEKLELAHSRGAQVNMRTRISLKANSDNEWAPLHVACAYGHHAVVERLLDMKADIDLIDDDGLNYTPLIVATKYGQVETMKVLIKRGADVNHETATGKSFCAFAARSLKNPYAVWDIALDKATGLKEAHKPATGNQASRVILRHAVEGILDPTEPSDAHVLAAAIKNGVDWKIINYNGQSFLHELMRFFKPAHKRPHTETEIKRIEHVAEAMKHAFAAGVSPLLENKAGIPAYEMAIEIPQFLAVFTEACKPFAAQLARFNPATDKLVEHKKPTELAIYSCCTRELGQMLSSKLWTDPRKLLEAKQELSQVLPACYRGHYDADLDTSSVRRTAGAHRAGVLKDRLGLPKERPRQ